jgi:hypothetical protein
LMSRIIHFVLLASLEHPLGHWFSLETPCVPVLNLRANFLFSGFNRTGLLSMPSQDEVVH